VAVDAVAGVCSDTIAGKPLGRAGG